MANKRAGKHFPELTLTLENTGSDDAVITEISVDVLSFGPAQDEVDVIDRKPTEPDLFWAFILDPKNASRMYSASVSIKVQPGQHQSIPVTIGATCSCVAIVRVELKFDNNRRIATDQIELHLQNESDYHSVYVHGLTEHTKGFLAKAPSYIDPASPLAQLSATLYEERRPLNPHALLTYDEELESSLGYKDASIAEPDESEPVLSFSFRPAYAVLPLSSGQAESLLRGSGLKPLGMSEDDVETSVNEHGAVAQTLEPEGFAATQITRDRGVVGMNTAIFKDSATHHWMRSAGGECPSIVPIDDIDFVLGRCVRKAMDVMEKHFAVHTPLWMVLAIRNVKGFEVAYRSPDTSLISMGPLRVSDICVRRILFTFDRLADDGRHDIHWLLIREVFEEARKSCTTPPMIKRLAPPSR